MPNRDGGKTVILGNQQPSPDEGKAQRSFHMEVRLNARAGSGALFCLEDEDMILAYVKT